MNFVIFSCGLWVYCSSGCLSCVHIWRHSYSGSTYGNYITKQMSKFDKLRNNFLFIFQITGTINYAIGGPLLGLYFLGCFCPWVNAKVPVMIKRKYNNRDIFTK